MTIDFACGHRVEADESVTTAICPQCGDRRVGSVKVRRPRFHGACLGPCADYDPTVTAVAVNLAPKGPLRMKDQDHAG